MERYALLPLLIAALVAAVTAPSASAAPQKPYEVMLSPPQVTAGVTVAEYTVQLTNRPATQQLGSADVTAPTPLTLQGDPTLIGAGTVARSGNVLSLRNLSLPPDTSVTVTVGARMTCRAGTYSWTVQAKQSNDFSGPPGNDSGPVIGPLTTQVTGSCALRFVDQPARARKTVPIRSQDFLPDSPAIRSSCGWSSCPRELPIRTRHGPNRTGRAGGPPRQGLRATGQSPPVCLDTFV